MSDQQRLLAGLLLFIFALRPLGVESISGDRSDTRLQVNIGFLSLCALIGAVVAVDAAGGIW